MDEDCKIINKYTIGAELYVEGINDFVPGKIVVLEFLHKGKKYSYDLCFEPINEKHLLKEKQDIISLDQLYDYYITFPYTVLDYDDGIVSIVDGNGILLKIAIEDFYIIKEKMTKGRLSFGAHPNTLEEAYSFMKNKISLFHDGYIFLENEKNKELNNVVNYVIQNYADICLNPEMISQLDLMIYKDIFKDDDMRYFLLSNELERYKFGNIYPIKRKINRDKIKENGAAIKNWDQNAYCSPGKFISNGGHTAHNYRFLKDKTKQVHLRDEEIEKFYNTDFKHISRIIRDFFSGSVFDYDSELEFNKECFEISLPLHNKLDSSFSGFNPMECAIVGVEEKLEHFTYLLMLVYLKVFFAQNFVNKYNSELNSVEKFESIEHAVNFYLSLDNLNHESPSNKGEFVSYLINANKARDVFEHKKDIFFDNLNYCEFFKEFNNAYNNQKGNKNYSHFLNKISNYEISDKHYKIEDVDLMSGKEFEHFICTLFDKMGYNSTVTKQTGDQGVDVIAEKDGVKLGVQAKCYSGAVGNSSVQEIVAGLKMYNLDKGIVVTNSLFTKSAIELARKNNIILWDRNLLKEKINELY